VPVRYLAIVRGALNLAVGVPCASGCEIFAGDSAITLAFSKTLRVDAHFTMLCNAALAIKCKTGLRSSWCQGVGPSAHNGLAAVSCKLLANRACCFQRGQAQLTHEHLDSIHDLLVH
jgi:hypothetical protein